MWIIMNMNTIEFDACKLSIQTVLEAFHSFLPLFVTLLLIHCRESLFLPKSCYAFCKCRLPGSHIFCSPGFPPFCFQSTVSQSLSVSLFLFFKIQGITKGRIREGRRNIPFQMKIERKMDGYFTNKYLCPNKSYSKKNYECWFSHGGKREWCLWLQIKETNSQQW